MRLLKRPYSLLQSRIAADSGRVLFGAVAGRGATLIAVLVIARLIKSQTYGQLALIQTGTFAVGATAVLGLNLATTKWLADVRSQDPPLAGRLIGTAMTATAITGIASSCALFILSTPIAETLLRSGSSVTAIQLASPLPLVIALEAIQLAVLYGVADFSAVLWSTLMRGLAVNLLMVAGVVLYGLYGGIVALLAGELAATCINLFLVTRSMRRQAIRVRYVPRMPELRLLARLAIPSALSTALIQGALWGGQALLLTLPNGYTEVAYFNVAYRWHVALVFISGALSPVALSVLSNLHATKDWKAYAKVLRFNINANLAAVLIPSVVIMVLSKFVMMLAGSTYESAWPTLFWLAVAAVPSAANNLLSQTALSLNLIRQWLLSDVALAVTLGVLSFVLIPRFGASGLAVALASAMTVTCLVLLAPIARATRPLRNAQLNV